MILYCLESIKEKSSSKNANENLSIVLNNSFKSIFYQLVLWFQVGIGVGCGCGSGYGYGLKYQLEKTLKMPSTIEYLKESLEEGDITLDTWMNVLVNTSILQLIKSHLQFQHHQEPIALYICLSFL